jgi:hypothetical protein
MARNGPINWKTQCQRIVTGSTTEAEFVALDLVAKEAIWISRFYEEIGYKEFIPTPIFCDNEGTIMIASSRPFMAETKHIDTKYHFIHEKVTQKCLCVSYVASEANLADLFTKPLHKARFDQLVKALNMGPVPSDN